ncbi:Crp/Fnr family transcriptional regulator [Stakelama sp. CBK3Z-3]|uniref:Crp/Fnr family transcriptional regulator n=1 Tax=Stakelama flava TaxID=2860338 RepID=A0ABS6XQN8_9SPHN|nr:Crp/Fnr family transcriptional regulator [Stakelama flava]MBW4331740.1 Crp/Fnr family transcriptional regulator [Stakelama flava]
MTTELFLMTHQRPRLTDAERKALNNAVAHKRRVAARQVIVRENMPLTQCTLLTKGFVHRYKDTEDGRRQILALHIPGDFVDLHSYPLKRLEHSVAATTDVEIALFPHQAIRELTTVSPNLTELLWRSTLIDAAINREWLVSIGVRTAAKRIAHLMCELRARLERIGMADRNGFDLPITQIDLADATGLTPVHTNRMLRQLRTDGLLDFRDRRVIIHDLDRLADFAEFDPSYLFLD